MNSTIKELIKCQICLNQFGSDKSCPRILPCCHTFCDSCIQILIDERRKVCPTCKNKFKCISGSADNFMINFLVKSYSETVNQIKNDSILSRGDAMKLTRKDLEERTFYAMNTDNISKKYYAKVKVEDDQISFEDWKDEVEVGAPCVDLFDFISSRTSIIDICKVFEEHKADLHIPKLPIDKIKYSKIKVKKGKVYFNIFKTSGGSDFVFEFGSLLKAFGCSSVLPAEAFLKFESLYRDNVVITTDGRSPRSLNFLLFASGIMDHSYLETKITSFESFAYGGHKKEGGCFPSVVEGIQNGGIYETKGKKRGDVVGLNADRPNFLSYFDIRKKDCLSSSEFTFGRVRRGMKVIDMMRGTCSVENCGLLLDPRYSSSFQNETHFN